MPLLAIFSRKDKSNKSKHASSSRNATPSSSATRDDVESNENEYVWSPPAASVPSLDNGSYKYRHSNESDVSTESTTRIKLLFRRRRPSASPLTRPLDPPASKHGSSTENVVSLNDYPLRPVSPLNPVFPSFHDDNPASSTRSLPNEPFRRPPLLPLQKVESTSTTQTSSKSSGGLFSWATRERTKSKPSKPPESPPLPPPPESFNLKSFRHVQPTALPELAREKAPLQPDVPPARPRGGSMASSDSAQRISVAQFRAQARRSSTNVATGDSPSIRPIGDHGTSIRPISTTGSFTDSSLPPPRPPRAARPQPSPVRHARNSAAITAVETTSDETSSEEESDSDEMSPSRTRRLSRQRTITKRSSRVTQSEAGHGTQASWEIHHRQTTSTRSELGHGLISHSPPRGPPPSSFQKAAAITTATTITKTTDTTTTVGTTSLSLHRRQRASYSTSELAPTAAMERSSAAAAAATARIMAVNQRRKSTDTDTSESGTDERSTDDDAPLSTLLLPARPGSSVSQSTSTSTARGAQHAKPLIDLNASFNPLTGKPASSSPQRSPEKERTALLSPTNISGRLSQLTVGLNDSARSSASRSTDSLLDINARLKGKGVDRPSPRLHVDGGLPSPARSSPLHISPLHSPALQKEPKPSSPHQPPRQPPREVEEQRDLSPKPVAFGGRTDDNSGFKVISRPQRPQATPLPQRDSNSSESQVSTPEARRRLSSFTVTSRPVSSTSSELSRQPQPQPVKTSASRALAPSQPPAPQRPFAATKRRDSPSSSTGGSSCSKAPLTPMDGSDFFVPDVRGTEDSPSGSASGHMHSAMKTPRSQPKRASVSFQELSPVEPVVEKERGRPPAPSHTRPGVPNDAESKRRDRRRSEAKAAIDLGNVINGRGPVDDDDDDDDDSDNPIQGAMGPRIGLRNALGNPVMGAGSMGAPMGYMQMPNMMSPQQFFVPPNLPRADPNFLAAHQQAMMIAKQAYQYAVAQQAMAAAGDEWERSSNAGGFSGMPIMGMGGMGMGNMGNMGNMGMGMGWTPPMFPSAQSVYGGSSMGGGSNLGWGGSASVYGEAFGPPPTITRRAQLFGPGSAIGAAPPPSRSTGTATAGAGAGREGHKPRSRSSGNLAEQGNLPAARGGAGAGSSARPQQRQRTKTAPSNAPLPVHHARYAERNGPLPPSSWKLAQ